MNRIQPETIFAGLDEAQLILLDKNAEIIEFSKDTVFIHEGDVEKCFYYLLEGQVNVYKTINHHHHKLTSLAQGEFIGELALFDNEPRSASIICASDVKLYRFSIRQLMTIPELKDIYSQILQNVGYQLTKRLRFTNDVTVNSLENKIRLGVFSLQIIAGLSVYTLSLKFIEASKKFFPGTTIISILLLSGFSAVVFQSMRHSGYPMSFYGLNKKNWFNNSVVAISLTIPLMLLILIIKWALITFIPSLQGIRLFDPGAIFKKGTNFYLPTYLSALFAYALFCPLQEFIIRGGIQTSLENFFDKEQKNSTWLAILVSNLLFASAHSHTSPGFALSAFIPGLFWGWLYARQRSLMGVGISHVLLGVWAAFIVGFQNII